MNWLAEQQLKATASSHLDGDLEEEDGSVHFQPKYLKSALIAYSTFHFLPSIFSPSVKHSKVVSSVNAWVKAEGMPNSVKAMCQRLPIFLHAYSASPDLQSNITRSLHTQLEYSKTHGYSCISKPHSNMTDIAEEHHTRHAWNLQISLQQSKTIRQKHK